jgi:hypothetical protein
LLRRGVEGPKPNGWPRPRNGQSSVRRFTIDKEVAMKSHARTFARALFVTGVLVLATVTAASAKLPALYVWYYTYDKNLDWCGNLAKEVLKNTDRNWHFTEKKYGGTSNWFQMKDTRGHIGCTNRGGGQSLVTIVVTGNNGNEASDVFEEIKFGVCGKCSKLWK